MPGELQGLWLIFTIYFEIGLGLVAFVIICRVVPWVKGKAEETVRVPYQVLTTNNLFVSLFLPVNTNIPSLRSKRTERVFRPFKRGEPETRNIVINQHKHFRFTNLYWFFLGSCGVALGGLEFLLIGAKSWTANLWFDFLFARSNGTGNGAHLSSYVGLPILGFVIIWKFREPFIGLLSVALFAGLHEIIWTFFYYGAYAYLLNWELFNNVMKDVSFMTMCVLFVLAWSKYPKQVIPLRAFKWPIVFMVAYDAIWFLWGALPPYNHFLPITVINNFLYGHGIYSETTWWGDPLINGIEVVSWIIPTIWFCVIVARYKK